MDVTKLIRDPKLTHGDLVVVNKTEVITKKGCSIIFPSRYITQGLAEVSSEVSLLGIYALVRGNKYTVSKALTVIKSQPDEINNLKIDDVGYTELVFYPDSTVVVNTEVVKNSNLLFLVWDEFITKGKIPWFIDYKDLGDLLGSAKRYTGVTLGANKKILELIAAVISRDPKDLLSHYRHVIEKMSDLKTNPPTIVKLNSVSMNASNTTAKLIGGYWEEGVTSALMHPSEDKESLEDALRL